MQKDEYVHRMVAKAFIPNPNKKPLVDHVDGNTLNNRVENLRWATRSENNRNSAKPRRARGGKPCTSKYKGVSKSRYSKRGQTWIATFQNVYIGSFKTEQEAMMVYNEKAKEVYGAFAKLNEYEN